MVSKATSIEVMRELDRLTEQDQQRVLAFARALSGTLPPGARGRDLLRFAGSIDPESLREMEEAIEEGCEQINEDSW